MTLGTEETTEIVAITLEGQADAAQEAADKAQEASHRHQGARDVIATIEQNLKGITPQAEAEIMADTELDDESKILALKHVARAMVSVAHSMAEARKNQAQLVFVKQGEFMAMRNAATNMRKIATTRRGIDRARAESVEAGEANKAAKAKPKAKRKRPPAKPKVSKAKAPKNGATPKAAKAS